MDIYNKAENYFPSMRNNCDKISNQAIFLITYISFSIFIEELNS